MSPYPNVATPEPLVVIKNRPRRRGQLTPEPRITRVHDGLSLVELRGLEPRTDLGKWPLNCAFCYSVSLRGRLVSWGYASACYAK
jgi:hypothetical protein